MNTHLIPIFKGLVNQEQIQLVNARELHQFLEVNTQFKDWITRRISEYKFIENTDFILIAQKRAIKTRGGDRRSKDYHLTLDMAKELSMVERTEKGWQARKYFIDCEKRLMNISSNTDNYDVLARQLGRLETVNECQKELLRIYLNDFQDFLEKLSPHKAYNISVLLNKISVNIGLALNYAATAHPTRIVKGQRN